MRLVVFDRRLARRAIASDTGRTNLAARASKGFGAPALSAPWRSLPFSPRFLKARQRLAPALALPRAFALRLAFALLRPSKRLRPGLRKVRQRFGRLASGRFLRCPLLRLRPRRLALFPSAARLSGSPSPCSSPSPSPSPSPFRLRLGCSKGVASVFGCCRISGAFRLSSRQRRLDVARYR